MSSAIAIALPTLTASIAHGRWFVGAAARSWGVPSRVTSDAVLATSECVTNAVVHGAPPVTLEVTAGPDVLRVRVADGSPQPLPPALPPDLDRPGGRGLPIIDAVSVAWGSYRHDDGKVVWFDVPLAQVAPGPTITPFERATQQILAAEEPTAVVDALTEFVRHCGAACTTPGVRPGHELPVDVTLGLSPPLVPSLAPDAPGHRRLVEQLPRLVEDARMMLKVLHWGTRGDDAA